jgi:hypothetical protein
MLLGLNSFVHVNRRGGVGRGKVLKFEKLEMHLGGGGEAKILAVLTSDKADRRVQG